MAVSAHTPTLRVIGGDSGALWLVDANGVEMFRLDVVEVDINQSTADVARATIHCILKRAEHGQP